MRDEHMWPNYKKQTYQKDKLNVLKNQPFLLGYAKERDIGIA